MKSARRKTLLLFLTSFLLVVFSACRTSAPKISESVNVPDGMIFIRSGTFQMGDDRGMPFESPVHEIELDSFLIDEHEVTVAEFARFVRETNYRTEAEKFGWSGVFDFDTGTWQRVDGADWRHPEGKNSPAKDDEPVAQVSWNDAAAYAKWAGKRLPTEAEFEFAARGGLMGKKYAWGDELKPDGKPPANWWQGTFPGKNTREDGFLGRAPVKSFAPNGYGLYDMTGNVWEWTNDWFDENYYAVSPPKNPRGAAEGTEKSIRGGSFLCAENFCSNYRVAGRSRSTPDSGMNNLGFRCARDVK
jgi:formylglycine-generating enzyme